MKSFFSLLILAVAISVTGCEEKPATIVGSGDEDKVAEYNKMVQEGYAAYEEGQAAAEAKGGNE